MTAPETPERLWGHVWDNQCGGLSLVVDRDEHEARFCRRMRGTAQDPYASPVSEYIRADIHAAEVAEARREERERIAGALDQIASQSATAWASGIDPTDTVRGFASTLRGRS